MACTISKAGNANNDIHRLFNATPRPIVSRVMPTYMGLRVNLYGPSKINSGVGVQGMTF